MAGAAAHFLSALARQYGPSGANEAHLASQLVPMHPDLAAGTWRKLQQDLAVDYPKRFGDITCSPVRPMVNRQIQRPAGSPFPKASTQSPFT